MVGQGSKASFVAVHQSSIIRHCERTRRTGLSGQVAQIHTHTRIYTHTYKQT